MKTRKEHFEKLRKIKETDRVLLLTHDDMDGAGAEIVLKALLPEGQVSVRHFDNGSMSQQIYKILLDDIVDKYDIAYMDIWNWINEDVYKKEMQPLKRKYARFLRSKDINPNRFNECWAEYQAKNGRRLA